MAVNDKIDTKVFVPTQKSLTKVINANIEAMSKITDVVLKSILSTNIKKEHIKNIESHLNAFEKIFIGNKNILTTIINASNNIASISRIKKIDVLIFKHNVNAIMNCYSYLLNAVRDFNITNLTNTVFESFIYAITSMNTVVFRTNTLLKFNLGGLIGLKFKLLKLKFEIWLILKSFNNMVDSFSKMPVDYAVIELFRSRLLPLIDVMNSVIELILKLAYLKIPIFIKHKLRRIKNILWAIVFTFSKLALTVIFSPFVSLSILTISRLSLVVSMTSKIFETLNELPVGPKMWIKIFMLNKSLDDLKNVFTSFNEVANVLNNNNKFNGNLKEFGKVFVVITGITIIMHMIADMPTRGRIKRRIKGVLFGIDKLNEIFKKLHSIKINQGKSNALVKAAYALLVISALSTIFSQILLMTPILILAIPAMLLFVGGLYLLRWVISITSKILTSSIPKMLLIMLVIGIVISMFTAVSVMFLLLAVIAKPIVLATGWILLMLGSITLVALGIVLIGTIATMAIPFLLAGILGFTILSMAVIALTAVAAALKLLQFINLDKELVENNVDIVIGTAETVLFKLFENEEKDDRARYEKRWERRDNRKTFGFGIHGLFGKHIEGVLSGLTSFAVLMTTVLAIGAILVISLMLKTLQFIDIDNGKILTNVGIVLGVARSIMISIFDNDEKIDKTTNELEKPKKKNIFNMIGDAIINHIDVASDVTKIIKSVGSVAYLLATLASVGIIVVISSLLRIVQELNLNTGRIESNVDLVLKTVTKITDSLFNSTEPDNTPTKKPWLNRVIHNIGKPITDIFDAVMSIGFLAISIGSISLITILARQLATLNDIKITPDVTHSVDNIINSAQYVIFAINNRPDISEGRENPKKKGLLKRLLSGFGNGIEFISSLGWLSTAMISVGMISKLAEHIKLINDLPNLEGIEHKTAIICNTADKIISSVTTASYANISETSRISVLERLNAVLAGISNITEDKVINTSKQVDNYIRFIDKVNTVDVNKLETSAKMFEQMARFSNSIKGDFDRLAESLGEKLLPVLEELKEVMSEIPDKLDDGFQNTSASIAATTAPATRENVEAQVTRENPNMTKEEVNKIVTTRMNEKAKADANSIGSKIDELISLLKGTSGDNVVVQTI